MPSLTEFGWRLGQLRKARADAHALLDKQGCRDRDYRAAFVAGWLAEAGFTFVDVLAESVS